MHQLQASAKDLAEVERLRSLDGGECFKCGRACAHCCGPSSEMDPSKKKSSRSSQGGSRNNQGLEEKEAEIASLRARKEELEKEKLSMLSMIDKLSGQIAKLKDVSRAAGHGDLIDSMLEESKLSDTMQSEEMSCFLRLYEDAVRRMKRVEAVAAQKLAAAGQGASQLARQFPAVSLEAQQPSGPSEWPDSPASPGGRAGGRQGGGPAEGRYARLPRLLQGLDC
ncbi:unnamed protein product, partial [Prorocentrum cordatum]